MSKKFVISLLFLASQILPILATGPAGALSSSLLITKLQTASTASSTEEFIEIFNGAAEAVDITDWKVEYLTASGNASTLVVLSGALAPGDFILLARDGYLPEAPLHFSSGMSDAGGHIRLRDSTGATVDLLGWGTAAQPETAAAPAPPAGRQLERKIAQNNVFIETDNNAADFALNEVVGPTDPQAPPCEGLVISEILPNPAGSDSGHEFIELHNPTSASILLDDCALTVGDKTFSLPAESLPPGGYRAFYDSQTGLTLPNAAGGQVVLITTATEQPVAYPADLGDNEAWADVGGLWQVTNNPSPNGANVTATLASVGGVGGGDQEVTPCPPGKFRNPATNRCKTIDTDSDDLTPCKPGQIRNPETNRCRSALTASASSLTPCKPGQERNPETNRCRSVLAAASSLKPCDPGEERNPDTNRCRKVASTAAAKPTDSAKKGQSKISYAIIAAVATAALSYGIYEYRHDLRNKLALAKTRVFQKSQGKE